MTDLHTHILPGIDDGSPDPQTSLQMLRMEREQGVDVVALTPHFYPERETPEQFLLRRARALHRLQDAISQLSAEQQRDLPRIALGAEVAWVPWLTELRGISRLCYQGSDHLLLELPVGPWEPGLFRRLYEFMSCTGLTPVIAHIDRYLALETPRQLDALFSLGVPIQLSASAFSGFRMRQKALRLLRNGNAHLLISDCHGIEHRKPNLSLAYAAVKKALGEQACLQLSANSDHWILPEAADGSD